MPASVRTVRPDGVRRGAHAGPPAADELPRRPAGSGAAWRLRPRTVRAKVVALLLVPVVSLMALWGYATVTTARSVDAGVRYRHVVSALLSPLATAVGAVQAERIAAGRYVAAPTPAAAQELAGSARATDAALAALHTGAVVGSADAAGVAPALPARLAALDTATAALPALRRKVTRRQLDWGAVESAYDQVVDAGFGVGGALTDVQDAQVPSDAHVLLEIARSGELLAREDAALMSAQAAGRLTPEQYQEFTGSAYARRVFAAGAADLGAADRARFERLAALPGYRDLAADEDAVRAAGPGSAALAAVPAARWNGDAQDTGQRIGALITAADGEGRSPYRAGLFSGSGAAVLLGLAAVLLSLAVSVAVGRGLVVELVGLRDAALDLATRRLPDAMRRLRAGEEIDLAAETARAAEVLDIVGPGSSHPAGGEIGQVAAALGTVQRAALQAAVERAEVLSGVSGVFVNLARRSQVLVHRQLTLLDAMERRTEEPADLEDLFRLDHLTTRMRRHAESLIILSGAAPGRAWRRPVPMLDVVRAAVAEVEDYTRVEVRPMPETALAGTAVADLVHLLAELVENATGFSPPHTPVVVSGDRVGTGFAVEIEDRGLGMGREAMAQANLRIADPQGNALFDSDRLGLFVVSRLARRQDVKVSLRPSAYGGTTAVVVIPAALLERAPQEPRALHGARPGIRGDGGGHGEGGAVADGVARGIDGGPGRAGHGNGFATTGGILAANGGSPAALPDGGPARPGLGPVGPAVPGGGPGPGAGLRPAGGLPRPRPASEPRSPRRRPAAPRAVPGEPVAGPGEAAPLGYPGAPGSGGAAGPGGGTESARTAGPGGMAEPQGGTGFGPSARASGPFGAAGPSWHPATPGVAAVPGASGTPGNAGHPGAPEPAGSAGAAADPSAAGTGGPGGDALGAHRPAGLPGGPAVSAVPPLRAAPSAGADGAGRMDGAAVTRGAAPHGGRGNGAGGGVPEEARLPRRVRQSHLAPQLRDAPPAGTGGGRAAGLGSAGRRDAAGESGAEGGPAAAPRSPEEARATMSALQSGWTRGRTGPLGPLGGPGPSYREERDDREL